MPLTDNQLRGILLQKAYDKRNESWAQWTSEDFTDVEEVIDEPSLWRVTDQLAQAGLIDFKSARGNRGQILGGCFEITAAGVDVIEGAAIAPITITLDQSQNYAFHGDSNTIQAGNNNIQNNTISNIQSIIRDIDTSNGTSLEKLEAKSRLATFLEHPLVTSVAGSAVGAIIASLRNSG